MIEIRPIRPEDATDLAELEAKLFSDGWSRDAVASFFSTSHGVGYLCTDGKEVLAYLIATLLHGEGELLRIGTAPFHRKRGLARRLLACYLDEARKRDTQTIFLEVRKSNLAALALYESEGFLLMGERKNYYTDPKEDALLYQKTFNE